VVAEKANGWHGEVVTRRLAMARQVAPRAVVSIKSGQPVLDENGPVAFIKVAKGHVTLASGAAQT